MPRREGAAREPDQKKRTTLNDLATKGAYYLRLKKDEKILSGKITVVNKEIKAAVKDNLSLFDVNGNHYEISAPMGDGMNEIFIQLQNRESVSTVSNIIALVREKLGDKAENFIMRAEVLHNNALDAMLNQGLITNDDILDWTHTKTVESLVIKANKMKT